MVTSDEVLTLEKLQEATKLMQGLENKRPDVIWFHQSLRKALEEKYDGLPPAPDGVAYLGGIPLYFYNLEIEVALYIEDFKLTHKREPKVLMVSAKVA